LLLVLIGREATREQRRFLELPKTYRATARFGAVSTTGDPEGEITETGVMPPATLDLPVGELRQLPPAYSAIKLGGERAYARARRGEELEMPPRFVTIHRFEELWREGDRAGFEIECSSGTYVRSLIADLGDAYCTELRRTAIGPFSVEEAQGDGEVGLDDALERLT
jgi:tRNA pseudouridine55 synthase